MAKFVEMASMHHLKLKVKSDFHKLDVKTKHIMTIYINQGGM